MHFTSFITLAALVAPAFSLAISNPSSSLTGLDKRELQRASAARIALAKARAARKSKRATETEDIVERSLESSGLTKRQLPQQRCSVKAQGSAQAANRYCRTFYRQAGVVTSANARIGCVDTDGNGAVDRCAITCPAGTYAFTTDFSVQCVATANECPLPDGTSQVCPISNNGYTQCRSLSNGGGCQLTCQGHGYQQYASRPGQCINTDVDALNCGSIGNRCPGAYNGNRNYSPRCFKGQCTLNCPRGFSPYTVAGSSALNCAPA